MPRRPPKSLDFSERLEVAKRGSTLQLLFKAARLLDEEALRRIAAKTGRPPLRRAHTALLPHIALEGTRLTELATKLGVTKQAVSQLVDDLEAAGVVARVACPDDARAKLVTFTASGRARLFEGLAMLGTIEAELAEAIGAAQMRELRRVLVGILATVERR